MGARQSLFRYPGASFGWRWRPISGCSGGYRSILRDNNSFCSDSLNSYFGSLETGCISLLHGRDKHGSFWVDVEGHFQHQRGASNGSSVGGDWAVLPDNGDLQYRKEGLLTEVKN